MNELDLSEGVKAILQERRKQIDKHGFSAEFQAEHPEYYDIYQLKYAANILLIADTLNSSYTPSPLNWDRDWFLKLCRKPQKDRIRIAAALLAAELDRLNYLENNK